MAVLGQVATEAFPQLTITQSQTWVPPQDGVVCIHVVGAGGGGRYYCRSRAGLSGLAAYNLLVVVSVTENSTSPSANWPFRLSPVRIPLTVLITALLLSRIIE